MNERRRGRLRRRTAVLNRPEGLGVGLRIPPCTSIPFVGCGTNLIVLLRHSRGVPSPSTGTDAPTIPLL